MCVKINIPLLVVSTCYFPFTYTQYMDARTMHDL